MQTTEPTAENYDQENIPPGIFSPVLGHTNMIETPQAVLECTWKNQQKQVQFKIYTDCLFIYFSHRVFCVHFDADIIFGYSQEQEQIWFQQKETKDRAHFTSGKPEQLLNFIQIMKPKCQQQKFNDKFALQEEKGTGKNSQVFLARRKADGEIFAVKVQKNSSKVEKQIEILKQLKHPNLIYLREYFIQPQGEVYIVMDYQDGGNLLNAIKEEKGLLSYGDKLKVVIDMINALEFLRIKGIVHRDIKPENIIHSSTDGNWKICDFGMAEHAGEKIIKISGTPGYMAPELLKKDCQPEADIHSDIYSMGLTFYEMFSKKQYYEGTDSSEILSSNIKGTSMKKKSYLSEDPHSIEKKLLQRMIRKKPEDRKNSLQIMQSQIYNKICRLYGNEIKKTCCRQTKSKSSQSQQEKFFSAMKKLLRITSS